MTISTLLAGTHANCRDDGATAARLASMVAQMPPIALTPRSRRNEAASYNRGFAPDWIEPPWLISEA
jgi:hypothetical protein